MHAAVRRFPWGGVSGAGGSWAGATPAGRQFPFLGTGGGRCLPPSLAVAFAGARVLFIWAGILEGTSRPLRV